METPVTASSSLHSTLERHLSHVKLISRLIGHELHAQPNLRVTVSRDELFEIQTSLDLFIEEMSKHRTSAPLTRVEPTTVPARMN
ncbi:MAG: hypothetical protein EPO68_16255 [Planctomycetota bacterium]|nr:MAG: hypothetical protein EPO68_16255 [Planctomycetota bacterium]